MTTGPAVIVVGISGPSSSGKTTLARLLRTVFAPLEPPPAEPDVDITSFIVHGDDFYKSDDRIPVTTTSTGKLVQDWDTIEAIDTKQFEDTLIHIRDHAKLPPKFESKEDFNDITDSGVDKSAVHKARERVFQQLHGELTQHQNYDRVGIYSRNTSRIPVSIAFVDGFLLYAPPNVPNHALRRIHDQIDLPLFLPVPYSLLKQRRDRRTGYMTIGPAPTPKPRNQLNLEEAVSSHEAHTRNLESDHEIDNLEDNAHTAPLDFWADPPDYVDDIVWPRYLSNYSWLLLPESSAAGPETSVEELKMMIGSGTNVREDLGVVIAPGNGQTSMPVLLDWAVDLVVSKVKDILDLQT
ncbi:ribosylnicotinamide kinase [Myotisia sp. PD_48]|nr:ribosylnicotinamide kinase [Myotisia sp. PD_48]